MLDKTLLRCGRISYTNDLPIYAAFDAGEVACPATLVSGVPTSLNRMLLAGELDASPISSFFCAQHADEFLVLPGVCIGSRRSVRSIYCISKTPPRALAGIPIAVSSETSTGKNLFATVCAEAYGFKPEFVTSDDPLRAYLEHGMPCLLIGDKAIDASFAAEHSDTYDVGDLWHETAEQEMVYAVWAVRRDVATTRQAQVQAVANSLLDAWFWGVTHRDSVIAEAQRLVPRPEGFYSDYYRTLKFNFDEHAWLGLETFLTLAAKHGFLPSAPKLAIFEEVPAGV